ncbi:MAG: S41 family peptidase [Bacteroidales bacterium]|nr:S41 family peptidase [Bacteroidales bacterium]
MKLTRIGFKKAGIITLIVIAFTAGLVSFNEDRDFKLLKNLDIYYSLFRELNVFYVDDIEPEKLIEISINEMLQSLDPYTVYIPESDIDDFNFATTGKYGGIGSLIRKSGDYTVISEIYKNFPADLAGLKAGDIIREIDSKSIEGLALHKVSDLLKGLPDTEVGVTIKRYGINEHFTVTLIRKKIHVTGVPYYGMLNENIGYIRLSNFTQDCFKDVKNALSDLKKTYSLKSLILDLRGNPGGLLIEAVNVSNLFVDKGQEIVSTRGKVKQFDEIYRARNLPVDTQTPLVVLVDRGSASASEIVAGALQDIDRAVIVGTRTFGKGLVQTTRPLSYNSRLKVTTAKYYIPSGRCIQALDYSNRNEDGSVGHIPDSLISEYKTKNGRLVYDGGGISPDIEIKKDNYSQLTIELFTGFLFFDFSTRYYLTHDSLLPPGDFKLTDDIYLDFIAFVKEQNFNYKTKTEQVLRTLEKTAKKEKYYQLSENEFTALSKRLSHDLEQDMNTFSKEIKILLEEFIVDRYYYRSGMIQSSLAYDKQIEKACELLEGKNIYTAILNSSDQ